MDAGGGKLFLGELADRLQQPVAGVSPDLLGGDERLAHQRVQHDPTRRTRRARHRTRAVAAARSNPPANTEQQSQHRPFVVVEQVVGPLHRVAQRLVAFQPRGGTPTATGTGRRGDHTHPAGSSTPSAPRPTRSPARSRPGAGRSRPPPPLRRRRPARSRASRPGLVRRTARPPPSRPRRRRRATGPATGARPAPADPPARWPSPSPWRRGPGSLSTRSAAASSTCSQLSNTISSRRPDSAWAMLSVTVSAGLRRSRPTPWPPRRAPRRGRRRGPARPATPRRGTRPPARRRPAPPGGSCRPRPPR